MGIHTYLHHGTDHKHIVRTQDAHFDGRVESWSPEESKNKKVGFWFFKIFKIFKGFEKKMTLKFQEVRSDTD